MSVAAAISNVFTGIFLCVVLSYYVLLFLRPRPGRQEERFSSITVIVPAHNEQAHIAECLESVLTAGFPGRKEIIVVDDGSKDRTSEIVSKIKKEYEINAKASISADLKAIKDDPKDRYEKPALTRMTLLHTDHEGKSSAINAALKKAKGGLIAVVDADSVIAPDALMQALPYLAAKDVGGVTVTIKVRNRRTFLGMWLHIEQLYNSLMRSLFVKVNANIVTPGPLSIYKKRVLEELGGFSIEGFSEDVDIGVRIIRSGRRIAYAAKSVSETYMPITAKGFYRQRSRFSRGWINIFKRHLGMNRAIIDLYTLPLALFSYVQAVVMGTIMIGIIATGYYQYYASQGVYMSWGAASFFLQWLSIAGLIRWIGSLVTGQAPLTAWAAIGVAASLLSYPLYLLAIWRYDRRLSLWHLVPLLFMFPFWLCLMVIQIVNLPELLRGAQRNIWEK